MNSENHRFGKVGAQQWKAERKKNVAVLPDQIASSYESDTDKEIQ